MKLDELFEDDTICNLTEAAKPIWRRKGNKVVRGYRCTSGKKQGQIVSDPATCGGRVDVKQRMRMKKTIMQKGARMRRKSLRTKQKNPVSKRLQQLNKKSGY